MKKSYKIISILLVGSVLLSDCTTVSLAKSKSRYLKEKDCPFCCKVRENEYFRFADPLAEDDPQWDICRTGFGLAAKNVKKVWASANLESVFVSTKKNEIREIDFSHWQKKGEIRYKTSLAAKDKAEIFSTSDFDYYLKNDKAEIFYSGYGACYSVWEHWSPEECKKEEERLVKNEKILSGVGRCWSGSGMFAYIQDNALKITGSGKDVSQGVKCYERPLTAEVFFEGKGEKIREVVCTGSSVCFEDTAPWCVFVLMEDGSVWGMGSNKCRMLSGKKKKFSEDFVKIISGGVEKIGAGGERVAVLKKDKTLWMWGRDMKTGKKKYSFQPTKVADGVKEFSIGARGEYMLILKTNHTAYGLGNGSLSHVFTKNYTKKWYAKPVKLMENVKHVYTAGEYAKSLILTRNNELYWTGRTAFNWLWSEWMGTEKWKLPPLERKNLVNDRKTLKMLGDW